MINSPYNPLAYVVDPHKRESLLTFVKRVQKAYEENRNWIDPFASIAMRAAGLRSTMLRPANHEEEEDSELYVDVQLEFRRMRETLSYLERTPLRDEYDLSPLLRDLQALQAADKTLLPLSYFRPPSKTLAPQTLKKKAAPNPKLFDCPSVTSASAEDRWAPFHSI